MTVLICRPDCRQLFPVACGFNRLSIGIEQLEFRSFQHSLNAVHHGISKKRGGGWIKLTAKKESENRYYIKVEDNGIGMPPEKQHDVFFSHFTHSVGMKNINRRLKHFCGSELNIESGPDGGTAVSMVISINESADVSV
ncbi:hypothetical protein BHT95_14005 [Bacillus paralicheniformis]|nr:hypothetical protein BHT95_14005 [Bacillus paralicheniformis]TWM67421.1 hypothetical protein CHCC14814_4137 [Bacillus paralicheniformis]